MRLLSEKAGRVLGVYAAVLGGLYLLMGLVEIVTGTGTYLPLLSALLCLGGANPGLAATVFFFPLLAPVLTTGGLNLELSFSLLFQRVNAVWFFSGAVLLVIGVVYAKSVKGLLWASSSEEKFDGMSFLLGGLILSAIFGGIYLVIMAANFLGYGLHWLRYSVYWLEYAATISESFQDWIISESLSYWSWTYDFRPAVWLFILAAPPLIYMVRKVGEK